MAETMTPELKCDAILKYVVHDRVEEYKAKGWVVVSELTECHHGDHAVLMEFAALDSAEKETQMANPDFVRRIDAIRNLQSVGKITPKTSASDVERLVDENLAGGSSKKRSKLGTSLKTGSRAAQIRRTGETKETLG